jgi:hypothetical protein
VSKMADNESLIGWRYRIEHRHAVPPSPLVAP